MIVKKYLTAYFLLIFSLASCATVKQTGETSKSEGFPPKKTAMKSMTLSGSLNSNMKGNSNSAEYKIQSAGTDSVALALYGPFGILVGKLFATPDYFLFYNTINNDALEGKPTGDNLQKVLMLPLSYSDFVELIRNEVPTETANFKKQQVLDTKDILFKNSTNKDFAEFAIVSTEGNLKQYQRKNKAGDIIIDVFYYDFISVKGFKLPKKIIIKFPLIESSLTLEIEEYIINETIKKPFSFTIPNSVKKYKVD